MKHKPVFAKKAKNSQDSFYEEEAKRGMEEIVGELAELRVKTQQQEWQIEKLEEVVKKSDELETLQKELIKDLQNMIEKYEEDIYQKELDIEHYKSENDRMLAEAEMASDNHSTEIYE